MVRLEKKVDVPVRVLRPGESSLIDFHLTDLEIVLFRPLHPNATSARLSAVTAPDPDTKRASRCGGSVSYDSASRWEAGVQEPTGGAGSYDSCGPRPPGPPPGLASDGAFPLRPPLFFDTAACVFYDGIHKTDYVATGRLMTDMRGVQYVPHIVVVGNEAAPNGYSTYNVDEDDDTHDARTCSESNVAGTGIGSGGGGGGNIMEYTDESRYRSIPELVATSGGAAVAAGDGIEVNLRKLGLCSGLLVSASLFTKDASLDEVKNVFYMVRKPKTAVPLWLVPLSAPDSRYHSVITVMLRRVRLNGESVWELSNVSEPIIQKDVRTVVSLMERRGLHDPLSYLPDFDKRAADGVDERAQSNTNNRSDSDFIGDDDEESGSSSDMDNTDTETDGNHRTSHPSGGDAGGGSTLPSVNHAPGRPKEFEDLLANVPVVTREGRRQYNVGHAHIRGGAARGGVSGGEVSTDEDDEILDDALRAVMPRYANSHLVRYDDGAYNVGSRAATLTQHYVDRREEYGVERAVATSSAAGGPWGTGTATSTVGSSFCADGGGPFGCTLPMLPQRPSWVYSSFAPTVEVGGPTIARTSPLLDRCADDSSDGQRPPLPPEFTQDFTQRKEPRRSGWGSHQRRATAAQQRKISVPGRERSSGGKDRKPKGTAKGKRRKVAVSMPKGKATAGREGEVRPPSRAKSPAKPDGAAPTKKATAKRAGAARSKQSAVANGRLGDGIPAA